MAMGHFNGATIKEPRMYVCVGKYSSLCKSCCQAISGLSIGTMCENDIDTENERLLCMRSAHRSNGNIYDPANPQKLISAHNTCTLRRKTESREEQTDLNATCGTRQRRK